MIEEEVKSLCTNLVKKVKESMVPREHEYKHQIMENNENSERTIDNLLVKDRINQQTGFNVKSQEVHKLSQKIQLIFNTLMSIADNMSESPLEDCLRKAAEVVMNQINDIINNEDERMDKLVLFIKQNEDEKLSLLKAKEELEEVNKDVDELNQALDSKLQEATEELKVVYEKNPELELMEEEIEELGNTVNNKDQQCQEMAEIIEQLEHMIEDEKQQNNELNQNFGDTNQEFEELKEEYNDKMMVLTDLEEEKERIMGEHSKITEEKEEECNKLYNELQNLIKINENLELKLQNNTQTVQNLDKTSQKLDQKEDELIHIKAENLKINEELERTRTEYYSLQENIKSLQGRLDNLGEDSKVEIKEKEHKINHLVNELSSYKDHMAKSIDLAKISHSKDLKDMQQRYEQTENEKSQYYYELKSANKELERVQRESQVTKESLKKESEENYRKLKQVMKEAAVKKEDTLKQSFKIVELMDNIREKDTIIDDKQDFISELQDKGNRINLELGNTQGVIETLQHSISAIDKERLKEAKLRKEEQRRLLELIEQKQALECFPEQVSNLSQENQNLNKIIEEFQEKIKNLEKNLESEITIANNKS